MNQEEIEQARKALLGDDEEETAVEVAVANREVRRVKPEQVTIKDQDLYMLKNAGLTDRQANAIRDYIRHIAARHISAALGPKEATAYAMELLDWAKGYATQASKVQGSNMTKAFNHIMRYL